MVSLKKTPAADTTILMALGGQSAVDRHPEVRAFLEHPSNGAWNERVELRGAKARHTRGFRAEPALASLVVAAFGPLARS